METLRSVLIVLAACVAGSAWLVWLGRKLKCELVAAVQASCADVCTKALANRVSNSPTVLIPEEHCLDLELKAALASHGITSSKDLDGLIADEKVLNETIMGQRPARDLVLGLQRCSSPAVAKEIFADIARMVDGVRDVMKAAGPDVPDGSAPTPRLQ